MQGQVGFGSADNHKQLKSVVIDLKDLPGHLISDDPTSDL